ncbi:unnamed protein product [Rotaria socialis]
MASSIFVKFLEMSVIFRYPYFNSSYGLPNRIIKRWRNTNLCCSASTNLFVIVALELPNYIYSKYSSYTDIFKLIGSFIKAFLNLSQFVVFVIELYLLSF